MMSGDEQPMDVDVKLTERKISYHACAILNELRLSQQLCDAVLITEDGTRFPVHRAILASASQYFLALFTNSMSSGQNEVQIHGIEADMMNCIIEWSYTRETQIADENVERLLPAADQLSMLGLVKQCVEFLIQQVTFENCIGIRRFARTYFCKQLEKVADLFLMRNFCEVTKRSQELMTLDLNEVCEILKADLLNCKNEEIVFETAIKWIEHDLEHRLPLISALLRAVRLGLLSTQYFVERVKSHPYIKDNEDCKGLIIETLKFLYDLDIDTEREVDLNDPLARPRIPHEMIVAIGGWSGGSPTTCVETYDTRADRWITCDTTDGPRAYHGCATVNHIVYVVGGFDGMDYFNSVKAFDPVVKKWEERAPMHSMRCYVSVAVHDNRIFAMGGFNGHVRQNTAEVYNPETNQWTMIQPMNAQRSDASATTLNGRVYICGGFNGQECLSSAEYYDPVVKVWTYVAPMRNRRSGVSVIAHKEYIYAVGGFNGITRMNSAERFSGTANQWTSITEMYNPRSNFAIEVLDDMIFAIGGFNGVTTIFNVECYDPVTEEWYDATDMNIFRSALSACLLSGIPNMEDYLFKKRDTLPRPTHAPTSTTPNTAAPTPPVPPASTPPTANTYPPT